MLWSCSESCMKRWLIPRSHCTCGQGGGRGYRDRALWGSGWDKNSQRKGRSSGCFCPCFTPLTKVTLSNRFTCPNLSFLICHVGSIPCSACLADLSQILGVCNHCQGGAASRVIGLQSNLSINLAFFSPTSHCMLFFFSQAGNSYWLLWPTRILTASKPKVREPCQQ